MSVRCGNREAHGRVEAHHHTVAQVTLCHRVRPVDSIEEAEQAEQWLAEAEAELRAERANERHFEERGFDDARAQEAWEAQRGVVSFEEAYAAATVADQYIASTEPTREQGMAVDTSNSHAPYDGVYTLESPPSGLDHRTFRLRTQGPNEQFAPGRQVIAYLSGKDNEKDYTAFGFVDRNALGYFVRMWKSFADNHALQRDAEAFLKDTDVALKEAHCLRCHRRLTTPDSIRSGYGPECAQRA